MVRYGYFWFFFHWTTDSFVLICAQLINVIPVEARWTK